MYWNVVSSPRSVASAPCRSIRFPSPRTCWTQLEKSATDWSSDAGASRKENRLSEGTALERDGEVWSLADSV